MLFKPYLTVNFLILLLFSCKNNEEENLKFSDKKEEHTELNTKACISCFNVLLKDSFDEYTVFSEISFSTPLNLDRKFYSEIENYYSFFVKLENDDLFVYFYIDTFDIKQRGIKFYQLNSINENLYINQNESLVCFEPFLDKCNCDSSIIEKLELKSVINTYDTHLFGTWASDNEEIEVSFEEDYFVYDYDTIFYEKLGSYLLGMADKDTLATIQAISMNNLFLNCDLINDGEMIYYKKTVVHPLSKK